MAFSWLQDFFRRRGGAVLGVNDGRFLATGHQQTLPPCTVALRGAEGRVEGGAGTADRKVICEKVAADTYAWTEHGGSRFPILHVRDFGAVGNGTADDKTSIQAAIDTAEAAGGGIVLFDEATYRIDSGLTIDDDNVTLQGVGSGSVIAPNGATFNAITVQGSVGASSTLASDGVEFAKSVTLTTGGVASLGLAVGDYLRIFESPAFQITRITAIAGEVVTLAEPLAVTYTTAGGATVAKHIPTQQVAVRDLAFDGTNMSGSAYGVRLFRTARCSVVACTGYDLDATVRSSECYGNFYSRLSAYRCGNNSQASLHFTDDFASHWNQLDSTDSQRFGPSWNGCAYGTIEGVKSATTVTRGMQVERCYHMNASDLIIVGGGSTGLSISLGSSHNHFDNVTVINCDNDNVWFGATEEHGNIISGLTSYVAGGWHVDLTASGNSYDNIVMGVWGGDGAGIRCNGSNVFIDERYQDGTEQQAILKDDFVVAVTAGTTVGELNWQRTNGAVAQTTNAAEHPGIATLSTSTTSGTHAHLQLMPSNTLRPSEFWDEVWVFRLNSNDSDTLMRLGLSSSPGTNPPNNGIYVEKLAADTSWYGVTRSASTETRTAALLACDTAWHHVRIRRVDASTIGFTFDYGTEVLATTNISGSTLNPFVAIRNAAAADKSMDLDFFRLRVSGLAR